MEILKRFRLQIICVAAGFLIYGFVLLFTDDNDDEISGYLERNSYGKDAKVYDLVVEGLIENPVELEVEIQALQYEEENAERIFDAISETLPDIIKGDNPSLSEIRSDLMLPQDLPEYGMTLSWTSSDPTLIDSDGNVKNTDCPPGGLEVVLSTVITDDIHTREKEIPVIVYPQLKSENAVLIDGLKEAIRQTDMDDPTNVMVKLPEEYDGKKLRYKEKSTFDLTAIPLLGIMAAILLYVKDRNDEEKKEKTRKQKLELDYADVVYQLMVFISAGMTLSRAWELIVLNYETRIEKGLCGLRPAYEEMSDAYSRIQCGEPEGKAIADFGRRCELQQYLKLSTLLEQNRRTGTKDLQNLLEQEMIKAWEQQKNLAMRLGEEAATKLLAPLGLMLIVVMIVVMVPAMMAM